MGIAQCELRQAPVAPHAGQPLVRRRVARIQRKCVVEVAVRRIKDAALAIPLRERAVRLRGRCRQQLEEIRRNGRVAALQCLGRIL
jgi:hypothetical protein